MSGKTYASNKELGLNNHGVRQQHRHTGTIPASAPGSRHYIVNNGGSIRVTKGLTGWRFRCEQVASHGGYELTVGSTSKTVMAGETFCRSRQQRVRRWQRTPQNSRGLDSPALKQRRRADRQLKLGSSIDPASLDPIHHQ